MSHWHWIHLGIPYRPCHKLARRRNSEDMDCKMYVVFLLLGLMTATNAQSSQDCMQQLTPAFSCLDYVQGKAKTPPADCCSGLKTLVGSAPVCLCELAENKLNLSASGITVDRKRALSLPKECKVSGADESQCAALLGSPAASPHGAVAAGPGPAMQSGGSETSTGTNTPGANGSQPSFVPSILLLVAVLLFSVVF